jgi:hypothetical protein
MSRGPNYRERDIDRCRNCEHSDWKAPELLPVSMENVRWFCNRDDSYEYGEPLSEDWWKTHGVHENDICDSYERFDRGLG